MSKSKRKRPPGRWALKATAWSFILAIAIGIVTRLLLDRLFSLLLSLFILLTVIVLGVLFDIIGTAAAAAELAPLNAKAARKMEGARRAVELVKQADRVANICNDVVGDISGIISGALAAVIVANLALADLETPVELYGGILLTALVVALTVGGKAWGKSLAINRSTEIILFAGRVLTRWEGLRSRLHFNNKRG